jgi:hypothetical protein
MFIVYTQKEVGRNMDVVSALLWIRIPILVGSRSGSRSAKITHKSEEISSFEVLDVLFEG